MKVVGVKLVCQGCNAHFDTLPCRVRQGRKFCSTSCYSKFRLGRKVPPRSEEWKKKQSLAQRGRPAWNRGMEYKAISGENHWNWKGGITPAHLSIRASVAYRNWREAVFKRDKWTCVWCKKRGGKLVADHIKSFSGYPTLRLEIDNGRTLCDGCHKKTDNYCGKAFAKV